MFCGTHNTEVAGIGNSFVGLFDKISGTQMMVTPALEPNQNPWPKACNFQLCHVARKIFEERRDIDAFYYFEPDNLPLTPDWYDKVWAEYEACGKPFWGVSASYLEPDSKGGDRENGLHMIGTGIYPQNFWDRCKGLQKLEAEQPNVPWDAYLRDDISPNCFFTKLITHGHSSRGFQFTNDGKISAVCRTNADKVIKRRAVEIPSESVVFHGCKDASLRLLWGGTQLEPPVVNEEPLTFAHAGDIGDLIYALPAIKYWCEKIPGILKLSQRGYAREPMTPERILTIQPLLQIQPYIKTVIAHDEGFVDFDFRPFRNILHKNANIVDDESDWIGAPIGLGDGEEPWLTVENVRNDARFIINRTPRYHNEKFPWDRVVELVGTEAFFIGLKTEWADFCKKRDRVPFFPTAHFLEVAELIDGCEVFIGNQSAAFAIAEGLKHPRIQEVSTDHPDCIFKSASGSYCKDGSLKGTPISGKAKKTTGNFNLDELLADPKFLSRVNELVKIQMDALLK